MELTFALFAFVFPLSSWTGHLEETTVARHAGDSQALSAGVAHPQVAYVKIFIEATALLELVKCTTCSGGKQTRAKSTTASRPRDVADRLPSTGRVLPSLETKLRRCASANKSPRRLLGSGGGILSGSQCNRWKEWPLHAVASARKGEKANKKKKKRRGEQLVNNLRKSVPKGSWGWRVTSHRASDSMES